MVLHGGLRGFLPAEGLVLRLGGKAGAAQRQGQQDSSQAPQLVTVFHRWSLRSWWLF